MVLLVRVMTFDQRVTAASALLTIARASF